MLIKALTGQEVMFLSDPNLAMVAVVLHQFWRALPFTMLMVAAGLTTIPTGLYEAATIDGCNTFQILWRILLPQLRPALISCIIFQFVWSFNDFLGPLIYISSVDKYPVALALKMSIDTSSGIVEWNQILAMSLISLLPALILFFSAQKYFVEGVTSSGIKG